MVLILELYFSRCRKIVAALEHTTTFIKRKEEENKKVNCQLDPSKPLSLGPKIKNPSVGYPPNEIRGCHPVCGQ